MAKRLALVIALLFIPAVAKADSYALVDLRPFTFSNLFGANHQPGNETISVTFLWDTTTNVLSEFKLSEFGPFALGLSSTPAFQQVSPGSINILNFINPGGDLFQLNSDLHGIHHVLSAPGTYTTDLFFLCNECFLSNENFGEGTATVTTVDAVSTPEPPALLLLLYSLAAIYVLFLLPKSKSLKIPC
jgi:hypothetical protein